MTDRECFVQGAHHCRQIGQEYIMQTEKGTEGTNLTAEVDQWGKHVLGFSDAGEARQDGAGAQQNSAGAQQNRAGAQQEKAADTGQPAQESDTAKKELQAGEKSVFSVIGLAVFAGFLLLLTGTVWGSLIQYKFTAGIFGSPFAGFKNYQYLLANNRILLVLRNSLILKAAELMGGLVLALPLLAWVRLGKKPGRILTKACLCLIPACLPYLASCLMVLRLLPAQMRTSTDSYPVLFILGTILQTGGFIAFAGGLFSYLHKRGIGNGLLEGVFLALLVQALSLLTPADEATHVLTNAMNIKLSDTLDYFAYRTGLMNGNFSLSCAAQNCKAVLQLILAIIPAAVLARKTGRDDSRVLIPDAKAAGFTIGLAEIIWIALALGAAIVLFGVQAVRDNPESAMEAVREVASAPELVPITVNTLITAGGAGIAGAFVACGLISMNRSGKRNLALIVMIFSLAQSLDMSAYLAMRQFRLINTVFSVMLRDAVSPRLIAVAIILTAALRMAPERKHKGLFMGVSLLGMGIAWGDTISPVIYLSSNQMTTLPLLLYRLLMQGGMPSEEGMTEAQLLARQAQEPVLLVLVALPALLLAAFGATFIIRAFRKAE